MFSEAEIRDLQPPTPTHITNFFTPLLSTEVSRTFCVAPGQDQGQEELQEAPPLKPKPLSEEETAAIERREVGSVSVLF